MNRCLATVLFLTCCLTAWAQDYDIYVTDAGNRSSGPYQILKFDSNGDNPEVFTNEQLGSPQDIVFLESEGIVLISNLNTNSINRHNAETGAFIDFFAQNLGQPTRMKIGPDGKIYVLQWAGNGRVLRYERDGTALGEFTSIGVTQAIGMDWDADGNLYVSSFNRANVRKFDTNGNDMGLFVNGNLNGPTDIWFDDAGQLLVTDWSSTAVRRFNTNGAYMGDFITGLFNAEGVAITPDGDILIGNGSDSTVKRFAPDGMFIENLVNSGAGNLLTPVSIVLRSTAPSFTINAGLNDAWFNPDTLGQGFFITVFPDIGKIFLAWFTFDTERPAEGVTAILGDPGHRWLTAFGDFDGNTASLNIELTSGGIFNAAEPAPSQQVNGTITVVFTGCNEGVITFSIPSLGLQGEIPIQRIALDNVVLCQSLATH